MPRRRVKLDVNGFAAELDDPDWDTLSERSYSSGTRPLTRKEVDKWEADNADLTRLDEIQAQWEVILLYYKNSRCRAAVRQLLVDRRPAEGWKVEAAVMFASGKPSMGDSHSLAHEDGGHAVSVFAQDPMYSDLDTSFLTGLGVAMLKDPLGQRHMARNTFGFVAGWILDGEVFDQCPHLWPKIWVGCRIDEVIDLVRLIKRSESQEFKKAAIWEKLPRRHRQRIHRIRAFSDAHDSQPFPDIDDPDKYNHNVALIWLETEETRKQRADEDRKYCAGCEDGRRDEWQHPYAVAIAADYEDEKTEGDRDMERIEETLRKGRWFRRANRFSELGGDMPS